MKDYRELIDRGSLEVTEAIKPLKGNKKKYTWDQINIALTKRGYSPAKILRILSTLVEVARDRLTMTSEATTAGTGVGDYSPPLGMSRRDKDKFSSTSSMLKQFDQCAKTMGRKDMLGQCRKMGMSLSHLKDGDLRKTLIGMSVRNKRKFMGSSMGMGMGSIDRWTKSPKIV